MNNKGVALPRWLVVVANVAIVFHLTALTVLALSAQSGPWTTRFGASPHPGPQFATVIADFTNERYLRYLAMIHNYHFNSNRVDMPSVRFEAQPIDENGKPTGEVMQIPDPKANFFVRQRQLALAEQLSGDEPFQAGQSERIPAPGQTVNTITFFFPTSSKAERFELYEAPEHLVPKEQQVFRPSPWATVLARSYGEHMRRKLGVAKAEITRVSRDSILPALMFPDPRAQDHLLLEQQQYFQPLVCDFGDGQAKRWRPK